MIRNINTSISFSNCSVMFEIAAARMKKVTPRDGRTTPRSRYIITIGFSFLENERASISFFLMHLQ